MSFNSPFTQDRYPNSRNKNSVQDGLSFQDFVQQATLIDWGMVIQTFSSSRYQLEQGESPQKTEIKLDNRCAETYRLSIEVAERSSFKVQEWTDSGIYAVPPSLFYIQGNYEFFYLFETRHLREVHRVKFQGQFQEGPATIRKFYLPLKMADEIAIRKWERKAKNQSPLPLTGLK